MKSFRINKRLLSALASIVSMILVAVFVVPEEEKSTDDSPGVPAETVAARVVDGDTIELSGGEKVRYIGVNAPESVDPRRGVQCFGTEASAKNKELVEGKIVRLEKDVSEHDKYDRLLRYVFVGDLFVNEYLVREGYARASSYPPDVKYQDRFREAEREAVSAGRGLWAPGACEKE